MIMRLSDKIVKLRKSNGWSQEEFAEKLNVSRQAISRWEGGTAQPDADNILQLSKLFGVTTDYLLNDDYESDTDIPLVQNISQETKKLFSKKKEMHLISAICFTIATFCAVMSMITSTNQQFGISCLACALSAGNVVAQFVLYSKKR